MAQTDWSDKPDPAEMQERYAAVVELARGASFRAPDGGWTAEQVLAHLAATTDNFLMVGAGVKRGEQPDCGATELVDEETLARRAAEAGGVPGLASQLEERAARLVAHAESLTDAEAATQVRFTVYHDGSVLMDGPRAWGEILAGQTTFHLPMHIQQLQALAE